MNGDQPGHDGLGILADLREPTRAEVYALHARLVARAADEGLLDVEYRSVASPFGALLVAATPAGIVRIAFEREGEDHVLAQLAAEVSPRIMQAGPRTDAAASQLDEYFARRRRVFELDVDLRLAQGFRNEVLHELMRIPYGATASYAEVAAAAGSPRAARAVGSACAQNPVPLVVPCHRVVRSDGSTGHYGGGDAMKTALLALEAGG